MMISLPVLLLVGICQTPSWSRLFPCRKSTSQSGYLLGYRCVLPVRDLQPTYPLPLSVFHLWVPLWTGLLHLASPSVWNEWVWYWFFHEVGRVLDIWWGLIHWWGDYLHKEIAQWVTCWTSAADNRSKWNTIFMYGRPYMYGILL